ncbi:MAG: shikimate dehydrogenase [Gammaproteobacteria bacterium]|nr:shikimate dehydrogenase [Gammaproteobacteria bacterium]
MDHYAVIGNPISHSKSPKIHAEFARQTGQAMDYSAQLAPLEGFAQTVRSLVGEGYRGMNVTVPFKEQAWQLVDELAPRAKKAGAVNTIVVQPNGKLRGDNTDGVGLVSDLARNGVALAGKRVLVLGAGGAVRGVLSPLLAEKPALLVLANRTLSRAEELAQLFADEGQLQARSFEQLAADGRAFDVVINGTAASLQGEVPPIGEASVAGASCYDMMYGDKPTAFLAWCAQHGAAKCVDGLGMLVEQAAEAFYLWRGCRPRTAEVIRQLRA